MALDPLHDRSLLDLLLSRMDQAVKNLQEQAARSEAERTQLVETNKTVLSLLGQLSSLIDGIETAMAAAARMEGNLRESAATLERLLDQMPGRRR